MEVPNEFFPAVTVQVLINQSLYHHCITTLRYCVELYNVNSNTYISYLCIPQLSQVINCVDTLLYITLMDDTQGMIVDSTTVNVSLVTSTVTLVDIFTVLEDQHYTVSVSLTIINGTYTVTNTTSFSE